MTIASSPIYLDTSALAKLVVPEAESDELERALVGRRDVIVSDLALTELAGALARRCRDGDLDATDATRLHRKLVRDAAAGEFLRAEISSAIHRDAERLLFSGGNVVALRAADAMHLALAIQMGALALVTFDRRMQEAARAVGTFEVVTLG